MKKIEVMKAKIGTKEDLKNKKLIFEPKLDGYRTLCYYHNDKITFISRRGIDITHKYHALDSENIIPHIKAKSCILDGEIVAYDKKGKPNFSLLQNGKATTFVVFDILEKNGKSLIKKPLFERKEILEQTVSDSKNIEISPYTHNGELLWGKMKAHGMEGVMAKEPNGLYSLGSRSKTWLKIKFTQTIDCIIIGYTSEKRLISSMALGLYNENKELQYIGKVGTGFAKLIDELYSKFSKIKTTKKPINPPRIGKKIHWVKPKYVCEIKYLEITKELNLRAPVFERMRPDKKVKTCTIEDQMNQ